MENAFLQAWACAQKSAQDIGVSPPRSACTLQNARRALSGNRFSEGFAQLEKLGRLDLSLEALAVKKQFTGLFSDDEANTALSRLLDAGYYL